MKKNTILGIALFALGVVLLAFGFNSSEAPVDQLSEALTGRYTDRTMWYLIGGGFAIVCGGLLIALDKRR